MAKTVTSQENITPSPILKNVIDNRTFPNFSLPRYTDTWSDCRRTASEMYAIHTVPNGTYFDEAVVIDEYVKVPTKVKTIEELYEVFSSGKNAYVSFDQDVTITDQFVIENGQTITLDLNECNITGDGNVGGNGRLFQINNGKLVVNGTENSSITASSDSYGCFRVEADGELEINDCKLSNSKGWGLNIKVLGGSAVLNNVTIDSLIGGGIEVTEADLGTHSKPGYAVLNDCNFTQEQYKDHCSSCLSVSGGSTLEINSGNYISQNYCLYVFSSGGKIIINGGVFEGGKDCLKAAIDLKTYPEYTGGFIINDGTFTGTASIKSPAYLVINKGTFTFDPTEYTSNKTVTYDEAAQIYTVK